MAQKKFTGAGAGSATVTAVYTIGSVTKTATKTITVNPISITSLTPSTSTSSRKVIYNRTEYNTFSITVAPSGATVSYSSSSTSIATVSSSGLVTYVGPGNATITVTGTGNYTGTLYCYVQCVVDTSTDSWNNVVISDFRYGNIGAGGGNNVPTITASQSGTRTWASGYTETVSGTLTYSYSMSAGNGFYSINSSTGTVYAYNRGTTVGAARTSNTITVTVSGSGNKSSSATTTSTQLANAVESITLNIPTTTIPYNASTIGVATAAYTSGASGVVNATYSANPSNIVQITNEENEDLVLYTDVFDPDDIKDGYNTLEDFAYDYVDSGFVDENNIYTYYGKMYYNNKQYYIWKNTKDDDEDGFTYAITELDAQQLNNVSLYYDSGNLDEHPIAGFMSDNFSNYTSKNGIVCVVKVMEY